jgi:hypothetical protein
MCKYQENTRNVFHSDFAIFLYSESEQAVFAITPDYCVLSREAANANFLVFGLI